MNLSKAVTHSIASEKKGRNDCFCVAPSCLVEVGLFNVIVFTSQRCV
jgi:hypothetical protein